MKIYLAGPEVFLADPHAAGEALKAMCMQHGATGLFPLDNEIPTPAPADVAGYIRTANMELIAASDAVVANMTPFRGASMDVGTAYEMGVAAGMGKVVVGYYLGGRKSYVQKVREGGGVVKGKDGRLWDGEGWGVEEFFEEGGEGLVDNLMMARGVDRLVGSAEEAVMAAVEIWRGRQKTGGGGERGDDKRVPPRMERYT